MWLTDKTGDALTTLGGIFFMFGLRYSDPVGLFLGNIFCLCGLMLKGPKRTFYFFALRKQKIGGTLFFLAGVVLLFSKWPFIGFFVEVFGFLSLCSDFFPALLTFPRKRGPSDAVQHGQALLCSECGAHPQAIGDLCLECNGSLGRLTEPQLRERHLLDPAVASFTGKFNNRWNGNQLAAIEKVYEILLPRHVATTREFYHSKLATVETPHKIQTFHSTVCWCDLGRSEIKFCTWRACGICTIIKSAFTTFEFGIKSNSGRFGPGIYSVMLACEVKLLPTQVKPSESSGILRSHEKGPLVYVSGAEAITPKYLIVYSKIDLPSLPLPSLKDTFIHILINLSILVAIGFWVGPPGQR